MCVSEASGTLHRATGLDDQVVTVLGNFRAGNILDRTSAGDELERRCQAMAVLEASLCQEPRWRYFTLDASFAPGERVARMNSATGDRWLIWFSPQGVVILGFDHESPVSP